MKHGLSYTPEYATWRGMKVRCFSRGSRAFRNYGALGVTVCRRWRESFLDFLSDMGARPDANYSIDRIDVRGNYSCGKCDECVANVWPHNCRWATQVTQCNNRRASVRLETSMGSLTLKDASLVSGVSRGGIYNRRLSGWSPDRIIQQPPHPSAIRNRGKYHPPKPIPYDGEVSTAHGLAVKHGVSPRTVRLRLQRGLSIDEALEPVLSTQQKYDRAKSMVTACRGNKTVAAKALNVDRRTLYRWLVEPSADDKSMDSERPMAAE